jgi:phosphoketolase
MATTSTAVKRRSEDGAQAAAKNLHVRGYKEEGTTTTPFDMVVLNDLDRFHLVMDVIGFRSWARGRPTLSRRCAIS